MSLLTPHMGFADQVGNGAYNDVPANAYSGVSSECGKNAQRTHDPDNYGGRTMCGRSVGAMVGCMARNYGIQDCPQESSCGNGKDFVSCDNGMLQKCGYEKIDPSSQDCAQPGAVLAYNKSPTTRGQTYGHVEFVADVGEYCSVYKQPRSMPWPKQIADACWVPKGRRHNAMTSDASTGETIAPAQTPQSPLIQTLPELQKLLQQKKKSKRNKQPKLIGPPQIKSESR